MNFAVVARQSDNRERQTWGGRQIERWINHIIVVLYYSLGKDMDVFSSILWHTQEEMELSKLAHDLTDSNKKTPQAWCAVGNCFSLQRDHESAIKFFERACQVQGQKICS
jgi:hypothetical protein